VAGPGRTLRAARLHPPGWARTRRRPARTRPARLSLTPPTIRAAHRVWIVAAGSERCGGTARVAGRPGRVRALPNDAPRPVGSSLPAGVWREDAKGGREG